MNVSLLYFDGCPNWRDAETNLSAALADLGDTDVVVSRRRIDSIEEAERVGFTGSPTILIDGRDPFAVPGAAAGLSCRIYRTDAGPAGSPTVVQLRDAISGMSSAQR